MREVEVRQHVKLIGGYILTAVLSLSLGIGFGLAVRSQPSVRSGIAGWPDPCVGESKSRKDQRWREHYEHVAGRLVDGGTAWHSFTARYAGFLLERDDAQHASPMILHCELRAIPPTDDWAGPEWLLDVTAYAANRAPSRLVVATLSKDNRFMVIEYDVGTGTRDSSPFYVNTHYVLLRPFDELLRKAETANDGTSTVRIVQFPDLTGAEHPLSLPRPEDVRLMGIGLIDHGTGSSSLIPLRYPKAVE